MAKLSQEQLEEIIAREREHMRLALPSELDPPDPQPPEDVHPTPVPPPEPGDGHGHGPHSDPIFPTPVTPSPHRVWTPADVSTREWWLRAFEDDTMGDEGGDDGAGGDDDDVYEDTMVSIVPKELGGEGASTYLRRLPYTVVISGTKRKIIGEQG